MKSVTRIFLTGATGKMGREIAQAVVATDGAELSGALGRNAPGTMTLPGMPMVSDWERLGVSDVVIDFSAPELTRNLLAQTERTPVALVIGTTGLDDLTAQEIRRAASRVPVVLSANMSLGVNVMARVVEEVARALGEDYDLELVELHHRQKKDAPSGTAKMIAEALARARGWALSEVATHGREGLIGARPENEIGVLAVRGGDIVGEHTAYFCGIGERIEITHRASSRQTFARGAVRAARWVVGKAPGLYDMQDVLGLRS